MANIDAAQGFEWRRTRGRTVPNLVHLWTGATIGGSATNQLFIGQPVKLSAATGLEPLNGTFANDSGVANGTFVGICMRNVGINATDVPVILARGEEFVVQADDDWTTALTETALRIVIGTGQHYPITNIAAGSTGPINGRYSTAEFDGNGTPADDQYIQIVDWLKIPGYTFGPFQKLVVRFHSELFMNSIDYVTASANG